MLLLRLNSIFRQVCIVELFRNLGEFLREFGAKCVLPLCKEALEFLDRIIDDVPEYIVVFMGKLDLNDVFLTGLTPVP